MTSHDYEGLALRLERMGTEASLAESIIGISSEAAAAIRHLVAERDRLEEALRPFADAANKCPENWPDGTTPGVVNLGQCRVARAALSGRKEP